ncbi:DHA1 family bicyclomycin/chloramphenicol resistance-like MFS transporter [Martelella mediterranea]|uniref:Bcr/CflA family efflux transporter n=2 Tax=Martelella mediterranea TaxID=293089 RepID=A0A4R3NLX3_9HYPH|nr:DHA1 family bicyclomycin/chloramphenicol resistance-like MFS transporter [Martelella mediterranea]
MMAALMALNALAIDIMLPGLPQIGASLGVADENQHQFIVTSYVLGFGIAQLAYGPLSDRFGRKFPLIAGLAIYFVGALFCAIVPSFTMLLLVRFFQGLGAAATRVISVAVVRDLYGGRKMAEIMSLIMMVFMVIPIIAPTIGQTIMFAGEWHLIFFFLAGAGLINIFWVSFRLPETQHPEDVRPLTPKAIASSFYTVLSNRIAFFYTLATMFIMGCIFGFVTSAPQVFLSVFELGTLFPLAFAGIGVTMAFSSLMNSRIVGKLGMRKLSHGALIGFTTTTGLWLLIDLAFGGLMPFWLFYVMFLVAWFQFGWIAPNFNSLAMEPLGHVAGAASSLLGFATTAGSALLGSVIGLSFNGTTTPMITGFFCFAVLALGLTVIAEKGKLMQPHNPEV